MLEDRNNPLGITTTALVFEVGLGVVAVLLAWLLDHWPLPGIEIPITDWGVQARACIWGLVATGPMLVGMWLTDRCDVGPLRQLKLDFERLIVPLFARCRVWQLALISLAAGVGEELLFRGLLQDGITQWLNSPHAAWFALIVASIVFGLAHMVSLTYAAVAALIGAYLGAIMLMTNSVLTPIVAHGLYDFLALLYLVYGRCGNSG
jgi:membrane protease YdiL (CAAX protease family)